MKMGYDPGKFVHTNDAPLTNPPLPRNEKMQSGRDYKLTFGKYRGETLEDVYVENRGYLDWLLETSENFVLKDAIRQCEKEMRNVRICK